MSARTNNGLISRIFRLARIIKNNIKALKYSFKAIRKEKKWVWIFYDGDFWIHRWHSGVLIGLRPFEKPVWECTVSMPLFTYSYSPKEGDTIVDVGAGIGTELQAFSKMVGPTGKVISIEADVAAFNCLEKLCEILGLNNVVLVNTAISNYEGTSYLSQNAPASTANMLVAQCNEASIPVPVTTLDSLMDKLGINEIAYLKMNIEGSERTALSGFVKNARMVRNWCISCHDFLRIPGTDTYQFVSHWLTDNNFEIIRHPKVLDEPWKEFYIFARQ
jgi:FkbM family methyltransferase